MISKKSALVGFLSLLFVLATANTGRAGNIILHVLAGQSNAVGQQGDANFYPVDTNNQDTLIKFWYVLPSTGSSGSKWIKLQKQTGLSTFPQGHFGPEITYVRDLETSTVQHDVALYKYAKGSTSIANSWKAPGDGGQYDKMVEDLKKAVTKLETDTGKRVIYGSFVWLQGESDGDSRYNALLYKSRLLKIIKDFRTNVAKNESLRMVLSVDEQHQYMVENPEVVQGQQAIADADPNIVWSSMIGLEKADSTHLTPAGLIAHGERLYDALLTLPD